MAQANSGERKERQRGFHGRFVSDTPERDGEAARLRARWLTYRQIAEEMGYADESGAYRAVQRALKASAQEATEEVRRQEVERLDDMARKVMEVIERRHVVVSGNNRYDDLQDDQPTLQAIDRLLKIQERRARYLGLDAPQRLSVDAENLGREIGEILGDIGGGAGADPR